MGHVTTMEILLVTCMILHDFYHSKKEMKKLSKLESKVKSVFSRNKPEPKATLRNKIQVIKFKFIYLSDDNTARKQIQYILSNNFHNAIKLGT